MPLGALLKTAVCAAALVLTAACNREAQSAGGEADAGGGGIANARGNEDTGDNIAQVQKIAMRSFDGSAEAATAGREAFLKYNCYGCHGGLAGGAMGPSLRDDEWKFGGTDEQIIASIRDGRPAGMPAWKGVASDQEMRNILVYIRSMRSRQEPTWFWKGDTTTGTAFLAQNASP